MKALSIAAVGLQIDLERLRLTSHNVANLSTTGYKRQATVQAPFSDAMTALASTHVHVDTRAGKLTATGQALDVALPEGRFLLLESDDGTQYLSRQGALMFDVHGQLRTASNQKVLGLGGAINLRADQQAGLEIDGQGQLKQNGAVLDTLRVISLKSGVQPQSIGDGLYPTDSSQWETNTPFAALRSGHLEQSNVVPAQEMLHLIATARHAESLVRVFQAADDMQATAIRRLGESN